MARRKLVKPGLEHLKQRLLTLFTPPMTSSVDHLVPFTARDYRGAAGDWPQPRMELRSVHSPEFLESTWQRIDALLKEPVQVVGLSRGARAVQVLATAIFVVSRSGQLYPFLRETPDRLECIDSRRVMVTEIPYGTVWLRLLVQKAFSERCGKSAIAGKAGLYASQDYMDWMVKVLMRRVRASHNMRAVRDRIASAIGIDADAWRLCHRLHVDSPLESKSSVKQYNRCLRHKTELLEVEKTAPRAVGIYAEVCEHDNFPVDAEPLRRLKRYLEIEGMTSRTWRLVLRDGSRVLPLVRQFYQGAVGLAIVDCLLLMHYMNLDRLPPSWLLQALFAEWGNAGSRRSNYSYPMLQSQANLQHLIATALDRFKRPDDLQEEQLVEVVHWLNENTTRPFTRTQRQGGWTYMVRKAREFSEQRWITEATSGREWITPFDLVVIGDTHLHVMSTSMQLLEEGRRMRNCIGNWSNRCSAWNEILTSVRDSQGKRIATAHYEWISGWTLIDAKGPMNRPLPSALMRELRSAASTFHDPICPTEADDEPAVVDPQEEPGVILKSLNWD